jgi:hypothetical protein
MVTRGYSIKSRGLFNPGSDKLFKVSRSGIELFLRYSNRVREIDE